MIVTTQKPIEFVNKCDCLVDYRELEKAILWYTKKPVTRLKTIYMHGRYPAVSIYKEKIHVHRLLMMFWKNRILSKEEQVHHKDENKLNALKSNLEIVFEGSHQSFHNKGKTLGKEHKRKIGMGNKNRKGIKMKKRVDIPLIELKSLIDRGHSINAIAKKYKCDWSTVRNRIHENPELLEVGE
ncbi:hypothetical protein [Robertmurraya siralis]|uniref:hypothetical protein n=1 Tax=Robertmurraya siralis TaxID=77777 RepID=UPI0010F643EB|nr:hypothetical protein [Robertmurraya siralis]